MVISSAVWYQIFRHFEQEPRSRDLAQMVVSVVNLTRTALINAEASRRRELLIDLAALEGIRIYPAEASDVLTPLPQTRPMSLLTRRVRKNLGEGTRFAASWEGLEGFWVSFRLDPQDRDEFWVMLPTDRLVRPRAVDWLGWAGVALGLSLAAAYVIVSRVNRPLRNIASAARAVGRGETPAPLTEEGPADVAEVARAFNQMAGDLASLDADRRLILAGVSHDLRTPLARLRLGVELSSSSDEDRDAMSTDIDEMDRIIGQFVDFARDGQSEIRKTVDLAEMLAELDGHYDRLGKPVRFTMHEPVEVAGRPLGLRRAVTNLIDNALRYAPGDAPVEVVLSRSADHALIEVLDRGPGIPEDQVERLKRPFTRLETARTDVKGSGLGLAIVDRIARSHDGGLSLMARDGGGLRAVLRLAARAKAPDHPSKMPVTA
ncbi:MAG: HAMP domain-containing protein [Rhodocyclaceae bacterium]|nr:HAMP domain-containing protein [Rhodocyclaceae bacterium]